MATPTKKAPKAATTKKAPKASKKVAQVKKAAPKTVKLPKPKSLIEVAPSTGSEKAGARECHYEIMPVRKAAFREMANVLYALSDAFLPDDADARTEPSDRFSGAWMVCLALGGWQETDFWEAHELDGACPICGGEIEGESDGEPKTVAAPAIDKKSLN